MDPLLQLKGLQLIQMVHSKIGLCPNMETEDMKLFLSRVAGMPTKSANHLAALAQLEWPLDYCKLFVLFILFWIFLVFCSYLFCYAFVKYSIL